MEPLKQILSLEKLILRGSKKGLYLTMLLLQMLYIIRSSLFPAKEILVSKVQSNVCFSILGDDIEEKFSNLNNLLSKTVL